MVVPKLIVFDLDYTLWPFWVDTHVDPPFTKKSDGTVRDRNGQTVKYYKDSSEILKRLYDEGYKLGVASRTGATTEAEELLSLFGWNQYFHYKEIYPGSKTKHFKKFLASSGLEYRDMLFFDDESRNIRDVGQLGVTCVLAEDGISEQVLKKGFELYERNHKHSSNSTKNLS